MTIAIPKYHKTTIRWNMILSGLSGKFEAFTPERRIALLFEYFKDSDILVTTSFGSNSIYLLHLITQIKPDHPVYFVDTGYHFDETLSYRDMMVERLGLNLIVLKPDKAQHTLTAEEKWWEEHPNMCCTINKIAPLQPVIDQHKVWMSSLMRDQTEKRARLDLFSKQGSILKFQPLLDMNQLEFAERIASLNLDQHPLVAEGYASIGCSHCTTKGQGREGRWSGKAKTECGLHTRYFK